MVAVRLIKSGFETIPAALRVIWLGLMENCGIRTNVLPPPGRDGDHTTALGQWDVIAMERLSREAILDPLCLILGQTSGCGPIAGL